MRSLGSGREFVYRYEDVPPHVRRIAERERQRVELETARRIQSSILPDLPPRLDGVDIAHAYLPASEVGGDFYDVLALEDGRLAVAVGDVAGHGVSSGLVMSMAKSALAVQVTFDPEVAAVFNTLNRMVHQTARKRLLATLCYALLDPRQPRAALRQRRPPLPLPHQRGRRASRPWSRSPIRSACAASCRSSPAAAASTPGDTLFLFSDGLVEARARGAAIRQQFGFERLEESLPATAGEASRGCATACSPTSPASPATRPREDDQTILVLRLPAAG